MEFSDLELVQLWHALSLSVNDWEKTNLPDRLFADGHPTYTLWDRIDEEVKARNIDPHAWTKTETVLATIKTIKL